MSTGRHGSSRAASPAVRRVQVSPLALEGLLRVPPAATGMVVFAHGSGSGRHSPRNNHVADALGRAGLATLLFDLLRDEESADRRNVFDIALLARRLRLAIDWLAGIEDSAHLPLGVFGASTGAAAALVAAAAQPARVRAVVSRGGRVDLAEDALPRVAAPTLLVVGGDDPEVLELNRQALRYLHCTARLEIVPGATHLFEEPGTLDAVVELSRDWFLRHLPPA